MLYLIIILWGGLAMLRKITFAFLALLILAVPVMAEDLAGVVAVVDGQEITLGELDEVINMQDFMMQLYQLNPGFTQLLITSESGQNLINEFRKSQLDQYVMQVLLSQETEKRNITISEERENEIFENRLQQIISENSITKEQLLQAIQQQGIASFDEYKQIFLENSRKFILIEELQVQVVSEATVSDSEAKEYYDNNQNFFKSEESVHVRHILVDTKEKAEELLAELQNGADFVELAKENSVGPTGPSGGDLGFITRGQTVDAFDEVAFTLGIGELSGVVETEFGFHIIKAEDKREAGVVPFEEVLEVLKGQLLNEKKSQTWDDFVKNLNENAQVEIKL